MEETEVLRQKVLTLRRIGVTTPEICRNLGLDVDTVLAWLMQNCLELEDPVPAVVEPEKCDLNTHSSVQLSDIVARLSEPASHYGYSGDLWTPCRLISQFNLPRGTLYRWIKKADLTFLARLRQQFSNQASYEWWVATLLPRIQVIVESRCALLYLLDELRPHDLPETDKVQAAASDCSESEAGQPVLICGISVTGRIAGQVHWCRCRVSADQVLQVLQGFLSLHPQRHLVILANRKRAHRTEAVQEFVRHHPQLHMVIL